MQSRVNDRNRSNTYSKVLTGVRPAMVAAILQFCTSCNSACASRLMNFRTVVLPVNTTKGYCENIPKLLGEAR